VADPASGNPHPPESRRLPSRRLRHFSDPYCPKTRSMPLKRGLSDQGLDSDRVAQVADEPGLWWLAAMPSLSQPLHFVLVALAGWINQQQREVIDYLQEGKPRPAGTARSQAPALALHRRPAPSGFD
jgi:hypothetical protein